MAGRDGKKMVVKAKARLGLLGAGAGVFFAAAAMATGSAVTAAPARADLDALIDPIIQPIVSSLTESIAAFDPAAALDFTSWTDSLLSSLNAIDLAFPSIAEPAAAAANSTVESAALTGGTVPLSLLEGTEPAVNASIDGGGSVPLLVDTGSSGLVIPYTDLGDNWFTQLEHLFLLGFPTTYGVSGYSGGVEYVYGVYNSVPVDYLNADGSTALTTNGPVDVELFSWSTNPSDIFENFQSFLQGNDVDGILGVGLNTAGPTTSPFIDYGGVTVDIPGHELIVGEPTDAGTATLSGAPITGEWISINNGPAELVANDLDSGGVTGTIPSSYLSTAEYNSTTDLVNPGTKIAFYSDQAETHLLYSYVVTAENDPIVVSPGTSLDSGVEPFLLGPISLSYSPAGTGTTIFGY
jgi:hypothetical protein